MSRDSPSLSPQGFWHGIPQDSASNSKNTGGRDPPRPAKEGFEWVWFPDGYWAERPAPRRKSSKGQSVISPGSGGRIFKWSSRAHAYPATSQEHEQRELSPKTVQPNPHLSPPPLGLIKKSSGSFSPPRTLPHSPWLSEAAQVQALQRPADQQMSYVGISSLNEQPPHARKRSSGEPGAASPLGRKKSAKSNSSWNLFQRSKIENPTEAITEPAKDAAVDASPSYFTQKPIEPPEPLTLPEEKEEYVTVWALRSLRKWFTKAPKNHKDTLSSPQTSRASISSPNTLTWITPNSPASAAGGTDGCRKHQGKHVLDANDKVQTNHVEEPACGAIRPYPADEAVSVTTPPIKQSAGGNPKSLFMDIKHPLPLYDSASSSASSAWAVPRAFSHRKGAEAERREWWDEPKALVRRDPVKGISFFEFDMPEHLPSSPMCPANPMHRLKGKGVCVFHGRSKQASMDDEGGISEEHLMESP